MKILLSNKYYYPRGGDCIHTIELENQLRSRGHEVAIFTMQHPNNLQSAFVKYFPSEVDFKKKGLLNKLKAVIRPIFSLEVKNKFSQLLLDFKPDIVHLNNVHSQLSPIIAKLAFKKKIPVIWTMHDYKLLCPSYDCRRNNSPCELCFKNKWNVLKYKCLKNSFFASFIALLEAKVWNRRRLEKYTNLFICPSLFLSNKMISGNFNKNKIFSLYNFIDLSKLDINNYEKENYYCYVGRLSKEKGIETLLDAAKDLPYVLKIVGTGPLEIELKEKFSNDNIEFVGFKQWADIKEIVKKAKFSVLPSEWYENNPLSMIESLCLGTPVIGANIGGIPELINQGENGLLFESGNVYDLKLKVEQMFKMNYNYEKISNHAQIKFSSDLYYKKLMEIYYKLKN